MGMQRLVLSHAVSVIYQGSHCIIPSEVVASYMDSLRQALCTTLKHSTRDTVEYFYLKSDVFPRVPLVGYLGHQYWLKEKSCLQGITCWFIFFISVVCGCCQVISKRKWQALFHLFIKALF